MAPWTSATWTISWRAARPAASPPPPGTLTSSSRPCPAPSPGWSGSSECRCSTGASRRSRRPSTGQRSRPGAQRILEAVQAARDDVAAVSGQVRGTVTLACTLNTGTLDLAEVLARIRDRHPGVIVKLRQSSSGSAGNLQSVRDGSVDIALCASGGNGFTSATSRAESSSTTCGASRWCSCAARTTRSPAGTRSPPPISGRDDLALPAGLGRAGHRRRCALAPRSRRSRSSITR